MKNQELADKIEKILKKYNTEIDDGVKYALEEIMELVNQEIFQAICDARGD